jgi:hypothetical protein
MDRLRSRVEVAERVEDDLRRQLIAAERALAEAREALRDLLRHHDSQHGAAWCVTAERARSILAASPGPNNAEKEGGKP